MTEQFKNPTFGFKLFDLTQSIDALEKQMNVFVDNLPDNYILDKDFFECIGASKTILLLRYIKYGQKEWDYFQKIQQLDMQRNTPKQAYAGNL